MKPARLFRFDTNRQAFPVRLDAFLDSHDQAWARRQGWLRLAAALPWMAMLGLVAQCKHVFRSFGLDWPADLFDEDGIGFMVMAGFVQGGLVFATFALLQASHRPSEQLGWARGLLAWLTRLCADLHPRARVIGWLDFGEPTANDPRREAKSPHSGSAKCYYRHPWLRLDMAFADGVRMRLTLSRHVKTKASSVVRDHVSLRGRMTMAPGFVELGGASEVARRLAGAGVAVRVVSFRDGPQLCFVRDGRADGADVAALEAIVSDLHRLATGRR